MVLALRSNARRYGRAWLTGAIAGAMLTACTTNEPLESVPPSASTVASPRADTPSPSVRAPTPSAIPSATPSPAASVAAGAIEGQLLAEGIAAPLGVVHAGDGSGALYVIEQGGTVRRIVPPEAEGDPWTVEASPFLDVSNRVTAGGERGLLGFAFHPAYTENRRVFAHYTDLDGNTVLAEYAAAPDGATAGAASERVLLTVDQPYPNHNGGMLAFGPDGYLYLALGDGGSAGDPQGHGQNTETLLGSLLRLDVEGPAGGSGDTLYAIPPDNPFVAGGGQPEIWSYGLRNPWRFSFDLGTGDMYIGDVGQGSWEEIDHQPADSPGGVNYGWNIMEGNHCYATPDCDPSGLALPIAEYPHGAGDCTVIGGHVYRGSDFPALVGAYLFADYCSGRVWGLAVGEDSEPRLLAETGLTISSFGEDEAGELYFVDIASGSLYRIVAAI